MSTEKPRRLGRGLEALLTTTQPHLHGGASSTGTGISTAGAEGADYIQRIPVKQIRPNPYQPRRDFRPDDLSELEASLKTSGLLQPITVRRLGAESYELVVGERRLRAAAN